MSLLTAAVIVHQPLQPPPQHPIHGLYTPQQKLQLDAMSQTAPWQPGYISQEERARAAQLAHLASQHQLSDYNRLKFGLKGAPFSYIPISLQFPGHVEELRLRQAHSAQRRAWWPSRVQTPPPSASTTKIAVVTATLHATTRMSSQLKQTPSLHPPLSDTLQHELSLAMSSQLSLHSSQLALHTQALIPKTSESHPINISLIVPFELVPLLSAQLQKSPASPALFHIPLAFQLDRLLMSVPFTQLPHLLPTIRAHRSDIAPASLTPAPLSHSPSNIHINYPPVPYPPVPNQPYTRSKPVPLPPPHQKREPAVLQFDAAELACTLDPSVDPSQIDLPASPEAGPSRSLTPPLPTPTPPSFALGNLLLSSCPGKKVRLTGPVKGRGAICRDLSSDLHRVKDLGVGCIICCLDDDELDFLGASWSEYSQIADSIGLDVLRLPTPEGLAPLQPSELDTHIQRAIDQYTLRGIPILVHCRGGVGRAGLVACAWMLKLGLLSSDPREPVVHLVERVISVVRRRRSVKAIETFEQVRFLVDFIEFLRAQARAHAAS
ncbi:phosphatases II [Auriculariales sp. MPI-PUGE-AT-0066]|nr:phosphatases II [Auriculariales sp. MPI-PUGE-AT-0066]